MSGTTADDAREKRSRTKCPDALEAVRGGHLAPGPLQLAQHGLADAKLAPPDGDEIASDAATQSPPQSPRNMLAAMSDARLPRGGGIRSSSPRTSRELLGMFAAYDKKHGLASVFDRISDHASDISQIYWAMFSRWPTPSEIREMSKLTSREVYESLVSSKDFQTNIVKFVLNSYPEKRRFLFVHVPKCAGSDLSNILSKVVPSIYQDLSKQAWTPPERLFTVLHELVLDVGRADGIFVRGHHTLQWFRNNQLNRLGDRLFTIVRDPAERLISEVNYIVRRLSEDRRAAGPDTRRWLSQLGMSAPVAVAPGELASRILYQPDLLTNNKMCTQFGQPTYEAALGNLTQCEIEITDTARYSHWLKDTWGIISTSKANQSQPVLTSQSVVGKDRDRIESLISEDKKLFNLVRSKLEESGGSFVRGLDLA